MDIRKFAIVSFVVGSLCSGCAAIDNIIDAAIDNDVSEASHVLQGGKRYSPIPVSQVNVYVVKPSFAYTIIGTVEARGMASSFVSTPGEKEDVALAIKALKEEAASIGANGVIIVRSVQVRVGSAGATERRIAAAAIRY